MDPSSFSLNVRILRSACSTVVSGPNALMRGSMSAPADSAGYASISRICSATRTSRRASCASRPTGSSPPMIGAARAGFVTASIARTRTSSSSVSTSAATRGLRRSRICAAAVGVGARASNNAVSSGERSFRNAATSSGWCRRYSPFSARSVSSSRSARVRTFAATRWIVSASATRTVSPNDRPLDASSAAPLDLDLAFRAANVVVRLREHRGSAVHAAIRELEARSMALALDAFFFVDELALRERAPLMRTRVVQGEDLLAPPHDDERLRACLGLRRLVLGHAIDIERLPFRAAAAPGMTIDLAAEIEDQLAAEIAADDHEEEPDAGRPLGAAGEEWPPAQSRTQRDDIEDERNEHRGRVEAADALARAIEVDVVGIASERCGEHAEQSDADRTRSPPPAGPPHRG